MLGIKGIYHNSTFMMKPWELLRYELSAIIILVNTPAKTVIGTI